MIVKAFDVVSGVAVLGFSEAIGPTIFSCVAFFVTFVQHFQAASVVAAQLLNILAVFHNAILRIIELYHLHSLIASIGLGAFGHIDSRLTSLAWQA